MTATALLGYLETGSALFNDRVPVVFKWPAMALLISILAIVDVAVFMRHVMNDVLSWPEEISKFVMVWLTFVVAPLGLRSGAHVGIGVLVGNLGGRSRQLPLMVIFPGIISLMGAIMKECSFMAWNARIQPASTIGRGG